MDTPTFQALVDEAYATWDKEPRKSYDDFVFDLPADQRMAVLLANLNYQVENGGFAQWIGNGYAEHANDVRCVLQRIGTEAARNAENLILIVMQAHRQHRNDLEPSGVDAQDTAYYKLNDQLMADAEAYFAQRATLDGAAGKGGE